MGCPPPEHPILSFLSRLPGTNCRQGSREDFVVHHKLPLRVSGRLCGSPQTLPRVSGGLCGPPQSIFHCPRPTPFPARGERGLNSTGEPPERFENRPNALTVVAAAAAHFYFGRIEIEVAGTYGTALVERRRPVVALVTPFVDRERFIPIASSGKEDICSRALAGG